MSSPPSILHYAPARIIFASFFILSLIFSTAHALPLTSESDTASLEARALYDTSGIRDSWFTCVPNERKGMLSKLTTKKETCYLSCTMGQPAWMRVEKDMFKNAWKRKGPLVAWTMVTTRNQFAGYLEWCSANSGQCRRPSIVNDPPPPYSEVDPGKNKKKGAPKARTAPKTRGGKKPAAKKPARGRK